MARVWEDIYWKWVGKGCDRAYAAFMADQWERRKAKKDRKAKGTGKAGADQPH